MITLARRIRVNSMAGPLRSLPFEKRMERVRLLMIFLKEPVWPSGAEITKEEITKACKGIKGCVVWTLNMQEYGGFIVDNSGHPKTYAEGNATADWDSSVWTEKYIKSYPF